jgi:hypothetical protein
MSENVNLDDFFSTLVGELESPGKGKKICDCGKVVGARTQICDCGYSFLDGTNGNKPKERVIRISKTFDGPGKGRLQCLSCKKYVGARSINCPICGVNIVRMKKEKENEKKVLDEVKNESDIITAPPQNPDTLFAIAVGAQRTSRLVYTPSGECKFKLKDIDRESVEHWCNSVIGYGINDNVVYLPQAIKYWLRFEYPIGTNEYAECSKIIDNWANELQGVDEMFEDGKDIE